MIKFLIIYTTKLKSEQNYHFLEELFSAGEEVIPLASPPHPRVILSPRGLILSAAKDLIDLRTSYEGILRLCLRMSVGRRLCGEMLRVNRRRLRTALLLSMTPQPTDFV